jgi:hypothetical protein
MRCNVCHPLHFHCIPTMVLHDDALMPFDIVAWVAGALVTT